MAEPITAAAESATADNNAPDTGDIGGFLRSVFAGNTAEALPPMFRELLDRLHSAPSKPPKPNTEQLSDADFKAELALVIPHLRAFGRSLSGNADTADDLVQETLLKAWAARHRFQAGTNMRAWTFIILRNLFLSQMRRARFKGEWDDFTAAKILAAPAGQDQQVELADLQRGLLELPQAQREALILVGAGGFAYEEAANICGCAVGTIKSRVARGRAALETLLEEGNLPKRTGSKTAASLEGPLRSIMREVDDLSGK
ncbi:MAG: sigma-70 family RNA polymerase sigma factor [Pacificimonas sp.]